MKQAADKILIVPQMRNVALFLAEDIPEKNVNLFVTQAIVPLVQTVQLAAIESLALAGSLCREMVMQLV